MATFGMLKNYGSLLKFALIVLTKPILEMEGLNQSFKKNHLEEFLFGFEFININTFAETVRELLPNL